MDLDKLEPSEQTRVIEGVLLPWDISGKRWAEAREKKHGEVFIDQSMLLELAEQDVWDSQFHKEPLILGMLEGIALEQAGLAKQETRGGYHRTPELLELLKRWNWR